MYRGQSFHRLQGSAVVRARATSTLGFQQVPPQAAYKARVVMAAGGMRGFKDKREIVYGGGMWFDAAASVAGVLEAVVTEHRSALQHMQPVVHRDTGAAISFDVKADIALPSSKSHAA